MQCAQFVVEMVIYKKYGDEDEHDEETEDGEDEVSDVLDGERGTRKAVRLRPSSCQALMLLMVKKAMMVKICPIWQTVRMAGYDSPRAYIS